MIAPMLAKTSFLEYLGLGDSEGVFEDKTALEGTLTGLFQVKVPLPMQWTELSRV